MIIKELNFFVGANKMEEEKKMSSEAAVSEAEKAEFKQGYKQINGFKNKFRYVVDFVKAHENLRQVILFTLFSMCCAAGQMITQFVLKYSLQTIDSLCVPFKWFIFDFTDSNTADFIGFLAGAVVGQALTFILNRKKTFKSTNNVLISGTMYAIMAVGIILLQTALGGWITNACQKANPVDKSSFLGFIYTLTGMAVGGLTAFVINFLGNKFLIMRNWGKKNLPAEEAQTAATEEDEKDKDEE